MTLPTMFPEEFVSGYVGRVRQILNLSSNNVAIKELHKRFKSDGNELKTVVELVACASAQTLEQVVKQHTLTPLSRVFAVDNPDTSYGSEKNLTRLRVHANRVGSPYPQFCPLCVAEDISFWGVSYWRRYHQIHGIGHCIKHRETALIEVKSERVFEDNPDYHFNQIRSMKSDASVEEKVNLNEFQERYAEICTGLLETNEPIGRESVNALVIFRTRLMGIGLSTSPRSSAIHDLIQTNAPNSWLEKYFPDFSDKKQNSNLEQACLKIKKIISSEHLILTCTALFCSATDALSDLIRYRNPSMRNDFGRAKTVDPKFWESSDVLRMYVESGFNTNAVARHFNLTERATRSSMEKRGYPGIVLALQSKGGEALKMFFTGSSFEESLQHAGDQKEEFGRLLLLASTPLAKLFQEQARTASVQKPQVIDELANESAKS